jgi:hypothetical protein
MKIKKDNSHIEVAKTTSKKKDNAQIKSVKNELKKTDAVLIKENTSNINLSKSDSKKTVPEIPISVTGKKVIPKNESQKEIVVPKIIEFKKVFPEVENKSFPKSKLKAKNKSVTLIQVTKTTAQKLKELRKVKRETYDDSINSLISKNN